MYESECYNIGIENKGEYKMNGKKLFILMGSIFAGCGLFIISIGLILYASLQDSLAFYITLPLAGVFIAIGVGFLLGVIIPSCKSKKMLLSGTKYTGKIHSYCDDTTLIYNGQYRVNIKVHYFDKTGIEREALVPTKFIRGTGDYPIGATIDIYEQNGKYTWDPKSVRYETIEREEELMDNKPVAQSKLEIVGICCPNCSANFTGARGYVSRCPYCGAALNIL